MKYVFIIITIAVNLFADIKVDVLESKNIKYDNIYTETNFKILCINGYQWLQVGEADTRSVSQIHVDSGFYSKLLRCKNTTNDKEDK